MRHGGIAGFAPDIHGVSFPLQAMDSLIQIGVIGLNHGRGIAQIAATAGHL